MRSILYRAAFKSGRACAILGGSLEDNPHKGKKCVNGVCPRFTGWVAGFKSVSH